MKIPENPSGRIVDWKNIQIGEFFTLFEKGSAPTDWTKKSLFVKTSDCIKASNACYVTPHKGKTCYFPENNDVSYFVFDIEKVIKTVPTVQFGNLELGQDFYFPENPSELLRKINVNNATEGYLNYSSNLVITFYNSSAKVFLPKGDRSRDFKLYTFNEADKEVDAEFFETHKAAEEARKKKNVPKDWFIHNENNENFN